MRSERLATADRILYQNLQGIRVRRVQGEFNLMSEDNAQPKIEDLYRGVQQDAATTTAALRAAGTPDSEARAKDLEEKVAALAAGYQTLQTEAKKPRPERKAAASQDWYRSITAILASMSTSSLMMSNEARMITPAVAELISIRQLSWNVRDYSGNECGSTRVNVARGQPFTPEQAKALNSNRGAVNLSWQLMGETLSRPGADAGLRRAYEETKRAAMSLREKLDGIYAQLDGKAGQDERSFTAMCNGMYDDIVGIGLSALELARSSVQGDVADARFRLILAGTLLVLALGAAAWTALILVRRFARPLRGLTDTVAKLERRPLRHARALHRPSGRAGPAFRGAGEAAPGCAAQHAA